ncbi:MAG: hypothetical protein E4H43_04000 [Bacteroidia bacterium]|nr:MAG: hypothetical protein E4H43_04000 [Bacteroidia bacterium]
MKFNLLNFMLVASLSVACNKPDLTNLRESSSFPDIFPDYTGVTIPADIAPLNFSISDRCERVLVIISGETGKIEIKSSDNKVIIPSDKWKKLIHENRGGSLKVEVFAI